MSKEGIQGLALGRMTDGLVHWLHCEYGKSIFRTRDDIVKRLNGEAE